MSHLASTWGLLLLLPLVLSQQYELTQTYTAQNFFDEFRFYTGPDPTDGFVQYVPLETAAHNRLVGNESGLIYLGVDSTNVYPAGGPGRPSVRLESKSTFTEGLFVLDLTHIPTGCGIWPAFWTVGLGDWPVDGEIDIIENVNDAIHNNAALHAAGECGVSNATDQTGSWKSTDCNIEHDKNQGCGTEFSEPYNFGEGFNRNGGGVYAMEWTSSAINIWFFPSNAVPESISSPESFYSSHSHPDPSTFNRPSASFAGDCSSSFTDKFFNHTIVFDTTFCGGWAGGTFGNEGSQCQRSAYATSSESCVDFVGSNPEAFSEAYWAFKSLRVWQKYVQARAGNPISTSGDF
ncbi:concanavalin A-like lectin/glucanase domain-containing protein [Massariosphaeria phaeospora]|uniref:Concanavalin A-like lectin/glucanase domain-containing protein n=1 Tax=Massariosphaeria phaeospora TaxID=100035 RepID=A0A7C8MA27_9PLEO|nr:concanavalin A-like lectin/glucanase domain-containing protein [Massariosphaeria phaeospora]